MSLSFLTLLSYTNVKAYVIRHVVSLHQELPMQEFKNVVKCENKVHKEVVVLPNNHISFQAMWKYVKMKF